MDGTTQQSRGQSDKTRSLRFGFLGKLAAAYSYLSFSFVSPILETGHKGEYNENSATELCLDTTSVKQLTKKFEATYKTIQASYGFEKAKEKDLVVRAIVIQYWPLLLYHAFWAILETAVRIAAPLCLRRFLIWIEDYKEGNAEYDKGWLWGLLLFGCALSFMLIHHRFVWQGAIIGYRAKVSMMALVHAKLLRLSTATISNLTAGHVVNLVNNDVRKFEMTFMFWLFVFIGPIEMVAVFFLLSDALGVLPALSGLGCIALMIPMQAILASYMAKYRNQTAEMTDNRLNLIEEALTGILAVKMLVWENFLSDKINDIRIKEYKLLKHSSYIKAYLISLVHYIHIVSVCVAMIVMRFTGGDLNIPDVFYAISLFALPRVSMGVCFTLSISHLSEMMVSTKRLDAFFKLPETDTLTNKRNASLETGEMSLKSGNYGWSREIDSMQSKDQPVSFFSRISSKKLSKKESSSERKIIQILSNIELHVKPGEFVGIIGKVGSGKSSLLMALLNDMEVLNECTSTQMSGRVAYCAQVPFITAATLRENIIFGLPFDEKLYHDVIESCELNVDIEQLPLGDATIIGERGVNLSGGQKARVSLARAAYNMPDISLLDDPLSALDARVARSVFERCIGGSSALMRNSTRLLVTHQKKFLAVCDRIIIMEDGKIESINTLDQLDNLQFSEVEGGANSKDDTAIESTYYKQVKNNETIDNETDRLENPLHNSEQLPSHSVRDLNAANSSKQIVQTEGKVWGKVSMKVYWEYIRHMGVFWVTLCMTVMLISRVLYYGFGWWVASWASATKDNQQDQIWVWVLVTLAVAVVITVSVTVFTIFLLLLRGSTQLHKQMVSRVLHAKLSFFHTNPSGRILNRFSNDMGKLDEELPFYTTDVLINSTELIGTLFVVLIALPYTFPLLLLIVHLFSRILKRYMVPSREIKRYEGLTRSPVCAMLSSDMKGLSTIQAYNKEEKFHDAFLKSVELNRSWSLAFLASSRWFGFRLDGINVSATLVTIVATILACDLVSVELLALALTHTLALSGLLQWCLQQMAEIENTMTSAERNLEYTKLDQEPLRVLDGGGKSPESWPERGCVEFISVTASYRLGLDPVLNDISFKVPGGHSVGIVGRTGSGKSSLLLALFRLIDINEGSICIDGVDTSTIDVNVLRKQIAVIPQDPTLFGGTFRTNLDPGKELSDGYLWRVLEEVQLDSTVKIFGGLDASISESGTNLSAGQRQLLCLARALLGDSKILALDEATANVDHATDVLIQHSLHSLILEKGRTLFIIAHRIETIMECDFLLVLENGQSVEFGRPTELLTKHKGTFKTMLEVSKNASKELID